MSHKIFFVLLIAISIIACDKDDDSIMLIDNMDNMEMDSMDMVIDTMMMDSMLVDTMMIDTTGMDMDTMQNRSISYLALGDSYTIGQSVPQSESFPFQLQDTLQGLNLNVDSTKVIARTGWTTSNLLSAIVAESPGDYDVVSLLIGVNNQFQNQSYFKFQAEFDSLLAISINIAGGIDNVFVVSIPDYGVTPFGASNADDIAEALDNYNAFMKGQCDAIGIPFIDITTISRELGDSDGALAPDDLHPSGFQYSLWVEAMLEVVVPIFESE